MQGIHSITVFLLFSSAVFAVRPALEEDDVHAGALQDHSAKDTANSSLPQCNSFEKSGDPWDYSSAKEAKATSKATLDHLRALYHILPPTDQLRYSHMMCTKRDVCLLMKQLDFRSLAEQKFKNRNHWNSETSPDEYWYYSTYKLKETMRAGGTTANSAACSFGMQAELSRKGWTESACAKLMAYRGSMEVIRKKRALYMDVMSNQWCPQIWEESINKGLACEVTRADRQTKYALTIQACEEVDDEKLDDMGEPAETKWYGVGGQSFD